MAERIKLYRTKGWRLPEGAVSVARPTKWGNPFGYRQDTGLARVPGALGCGEWEYEGRVSADGMRHDYFHPGGKVTSCTVRYMTRPELVETYRHVLTGNLTPALISAGGGWRFGIPPIADVRRELASLDLACWCPLPRPGQPDYCHAAILLWVASSARPWTPAVRLPGGGQRFTTKRCCNGCGDQVGDVTEAEISSAVDGWPLPDARGECWRCSPLLAAAGG